MGGGVSHGATWLVRAKLGWVRGLVARRQQPLSAREARREMETGRPFDKAFVGCVSGDLSDDQEKRGRKR